MKKVSVIGAGSWGTALSMVLSDNGHNVVLWTHRQNQADEINLRHTNRKYLPGVAIPEAVRATSDL
ncbi:MAG: glycerol-3-phosphate dehydrogenase, partial [Sporolactobacillus sp.]|nr:glycerol-3-phosphate dehydrogenase [Sporolactobacillus sp.]